MIRRPLRIATVRAFERSVRAAGFDVCVVPDSIGSDIHRPIGQRMREGQALREFLDEQGADLLIDTNASLLTFVPSASGAGPVALANAAAGVPYVSCYLDPITSVMSQVPWDDHWRLLRHPDWTKGISDMAHQEELLRFGAANVIRLPMAMVDRDFDTRPEPEPSPGPVVAFMGHPATSWFRSPHAVAPSQLYAGMLAAAVHADMPDVPFHKIYYDLYQLADPPRPQDDADTLTRKAQQYFADKFTYNAFLAIRQRDRWARFLKSKLGDVFELIGDYWGENWGLPATPRIWDMDELYRRMRHVPICLNLIKGNMESGLILRHFEITACGGFMLTFPTPELSQFFEIGKECEVFTDEKDLLDKIAYYLDHPKQRYEIAAAGQRRTLSENLYSHRIAHVVKVLRSAGMHKNNRENADADFRTCVSTPART